MGAEGAANVLYAKDIAKAEDPAAKRTEIIAEYNEKFANPYVAAGLGYVDEVIDPMNTRPVLIRALEMCRNKRVSNPPRKHGNLPL